MKAGSSDKRWVVKRAQTMAVWRAVQKVCSTADQMVDDWVWRMAALKVLHWAVMKGVHWADSTDNSKAAQKAERMDAQRADLTA